MRIHRVLLMSFLVPLVVQAQTSTAPYQLTGSFSALSNSFNGVPDARQPLIGWNAGLAIPAWHNLRFVLDASAFQGKNLGAPQNVTFLSGGGLYGHQFGREMVFGKMLFGEANLGRNWPGNHISGTTASFTVYGGGGVDTPISKHFSLRVEGGVQHTNFAYERFFPSGSTPSFPYYRVPGLPENFGRVSTGLVWSPRVAHPGSEVVLATTPDSRPESEVAFVYESSVGHWRILAGTFWSFLHVGGVEYDRHSWGQFLRAHIDYVAEFLPAVVLREPAITDAYGDRLNNTKYKTISGVAVTPIGARLLWFDGHLIKPFVSAKGGVVGYTQKALSSDGTYLNFTLQEAVGVEVRLTHTWEMRAAFSDFHFSNAFMAPSDPGIDEMMYNFGLSYHLHSQMPR